MEKKMNILQINASIRATDANSTRVANSIVAQLQAKHPAARLTVRDLVGFGRYPYSKGRPTIEDKVHIDRALEYLNLETLADRFLDELSGGQRQRAFVAMVLCQDTDYVLLDEPLNNLDMYYARNLMQLLQRLTHEHDRTTVVVLHDINQAAAYADHVVAMQNGEVVFAGPPNEVFTPANIQTLFSMDVAVLDYEGKKLVVHHV